MSSHNVAPDSRKPTLQLALYKPSTWLKSWVFLNRRVDDSSFRPHGDLMTIQFAGRIMFVVGRVKACRNSL